MTAPWIPPEIVIQHGEQHNIVNSNMMGPPNLFMYGSSNRGPHGRFWEYNEHPFVRPRTEYTYWPGVSYKDVDTFRMTRQKYASVYTDDYKLRLASSGQAYLGWPDNGTWPLRQNLKNLFEIDTSLLQAEPNAVGPCAGSMHLRYNNADWNIINWYARNNTDMHSFLDEHETEVSHGIPYWEYYVKDGLPANDPFVSNSSPIHEMFMTNDKRYHDHFTYFTYWPTGSDPSMDRFRVTPVYNFFIAYEEQIADIPDGAEILLPNFYMYETALRTWNMYHRELTLNNQQLFPTQTNSEWFHSHFWNPFGWLGVIPEANAQYFQSFGDAIASTPAPLLSAQLGVFRNRTETLAVMYSDLDILNKYDIRDEQSPTTADDDIAAHIYYPFYNKIEIDDGTNREDWYAPGAWRVANNISLPNGYYQGPLSQLLHYLDIAPGCGNGNGYMFIDYMQAYVADRYKNFVGPTEDWHHPNYYKSINFDYQSRLYARPEKYSGNQEYVVYLDLENMINEYLEDVASGLLGADLNGDGFISHSSLMTPGATAGILNNPSHLLAAMLDPAASKPYPAGNPNPPYRSTNLTFLRDYEDTGYPTAQVKYRHILGYLKVMMEHLAAGTGNIGALKVVGDAAPSYESVGPHITSWIRAFKDIVIGNDGTFFDEWRTSALSDVLFYVIEKSIVAEDGTTSAPIQRILISPNFGTRANGAGAGNFHYYDTQVRYGVRYKYEVKQLRVIFGNEYEYTGITTAEGIGTGYGRALGNALGYFKDEQNYPEPLALYQPSLDNPAYQQYWLPENEDSDWSTNPTSYGPKALYGAYLFEPSNHYNLTGFYEAEQGLGPSVYSYLHPMTPLVLSAPGEIGTWTNVPQLDQSQVNLESFWFNARGGWGLDGNYQGGLVAGFFDFQPMGDMECPDGSSAVWMGTWYTGQWVCIPDFPPTDEAALDEEELLWDLSVSDFMDEFNNTINSLNTSGWEIGVEDFTNQLAEELSSWFTGTGGAVPPGPVGAFILELIDAGVFSGPHGGPGGGTGPPGGGPAPPVNFNPTNYNFLPSVSFAAYTQFMVDAATNGRLQALQTSGLNTQHPQFQLTMYVVLTTLASSTNLLHNMVTSPAGVAAYGTSPLSNPLVARALMGPAGTELAKMNLGSFGGRTELAYQLLTQQPAGSNAAALLQGYVDGTLDTPSQHAAANLLINESALDMGFGNFTVGAIDVQWLGF